MICSSKFTPNNVSPLTSASGQCTELHKGASIVTRWSVWLRHGGGPSRFDQDALMCVWLETGQLCLVLAGRTKAHLATVHVNAVEEGAVAWQPGEFS